MSMSTLVPQSSDRKSTASGLRPLRVAFVMHVMQVAGAEVLVKRIIEQLGDEIRPVVFCLDQVGEIGEELRQQGLDVVCLNRVPGIDWRLGLRLAKLLDQYQIEVVHAHQYTPFFYTALARLARAFRWNKSPGCKVLFTEHGRHVPDVISARRYWVNRLWLQRYAHATNACSQFSAQALCENDGFASVDVVRNGIDVGEFPPRGDDIELAALRARLGLQTDLLYVACVARFHSVKDHTTLLRAWDKLTRTRADARLLLVGDGEQREPMTRLTAELGMESTVEFMGVRRDVSDILRAVDVFALTSKSEASSLTLLEAMASECAIVATDVGGNAEHLTDAEQGILVSPGDVDEVAEAIEHLLDHPETCRLLGAAARCRVRSDFDLGRVVQAYRELYHQLAGR